MYAFGQGVPQDDKEAVKWYKLAAKQGNLRAQNNLGFMYEMGKGVSQDYKTAHKWYTSAANQGFSLAQESAKKLEEKIAKNAAAQRVAREQAARLKEIEIQVQNLQREQARQQELYNAQMQIYQKQVEEQRRAREFNEGMALMGLGLGIMEGGSLGGGGGRPIQLPAIAPPKTTDLACFRRCLERYGRDPSNSNVGMCQSNCTR